MVRSWSHRTAHEKGPARRRALRGVIGSGSDQSFWHLPQQPPPHPPPQQPSAWTVLLAATTRAPAALHLQSSPHEHAPPSEHPQQEAMHEQSALQAQASPVAHEQVAAPHLQSSPHEHPPPQQEALPEQVAQSAQDSQHPPAQSEEQSAQQAAVFEAPMTRALDVLPVEEQAAMANAKRPATKRSMMFLVITLNISISAHIQVRCTCVRVCVRQPHRTCRW